MRIGYCAQCSPKVVIAVGVPATYSKREHVTTTEKTRQMKDVKVTRAVWKEHPAPAPTHRTPDGKVHQAKVIDVDETPRAPGEDPGKYLARLAKTFAAKLV
jgi:hypothetical protein